MILRKNTDNIILNKGSKKIKIFSDIFEPFF